MKLNRLFCVTLALLCLAPLAFCGCKSKGPRPLKEYLVGQAESSVTNSGSKARYVA